MQKTIAYILSCNYSGSHYLSLLLGSHLKITHIGEVKWLRKKKTSVKPCFVCNNLAECRVLKGVEPNNIKDVYEIIFSNVGPECSLLVDTSKKIFWAKKFLNDNRYQMKYIHLIRDPRAIARRQLISRPDDKFRMRFKIARFFPKKTISLFTKDLWYVYLYKWLRENIMITSFIKRNKLDAFVVTYKELAQEPERIISEIMTWLGLKYEPEQLQYWNFEHHGSQKPNYEWVKNEKTRHFDVRWKTYLPENIQHEITHDRAVNEYLSELGICFTDDGLKKHR